MSRILHICAVLAAWMSVLPYICGQTRIDPAQIKAWEQVAPPAVVKDSLTTGTRLQLAQVAIAQPFVDSWTMIILLDDYDHYRVAVGTDQPPVLIVCLRPKTDPLGPGCVGGLFWFAVHRK